jgi:hypothetical protein
MKNIIKPFAALFLLALVISGCQKDDNFLIKEEAFSVITAGYNGSQDELTVVIDTMTMFTNIVSNSSFKTTNKYTFMEGQDSVKYLVKEKQTGKIVYEKMVGRGQYSLTIDLIYVNGKLLKKPELPPVKEGFRQASYLFLPLVTGYSGDIDVVYLKAWQVVRNGLLVNEREEELARVTATPNEFSPFIQAPIFTGGRTEENGVVYFVNADIKYCRSGTSIPYYEDAGFSINPNFRKAYLNESKPQITGILELGSTEDKYISNNQLIVF